MKIQSAKAGIGTGRAGLQAASGLFSNAGLFQKGVKSFFNILDLQPAAAYSLRSFDANADPNVVNVRRSTGGTSDFTASDVSNGTLTSWVNGANPQVMDNPDITSASNWTNGSNTTFNSSTEAFDLANENGLTVRQGKAIAGQTYEVTLVISSFTSGALKIYAGGNQSDPIDSAGTHIIQITAGTSNDIFGINPHGVATASIASFNVIQTTADGHVTTWYDQSGNNNSSTQVVASSQPLIVDAGTLVIESGEPAIHFDGVDDQLHSNLASEISQPSYSFLVHNFHSTPSAYAGVIGSIGNEHRLILGGSLQYAIQAGGGLNYSQYETNEALISYRIQASAPLLNVNGSTESVTSGSLIGSNSLQGILIGAINENIASSGNAPINCKELIIFAGDQESNRTGIENNMNDHYSIY